MRIRAILADGDGCLYQTVEHITESTLLTAASFGIETTASAIKAAFSQGMSGEEMLRLVIPEAGTEELVSRFYEFGEQIGYGSITLYEGVDFALQTLQLNKRKAALITNRARQSTLAIIDRLKIGQLLDEVITADDITHAKPHPEGAFKALGSLGISATNAVMIGDTAGDILMGKEAGMAATLGFTGGFGTTKQLLEAGATELLPSWKILPLILRI